MVLRLVVTADIHIHPYRICSRDGGQDRLNDGLSVLRQSLDLARKYQAVWVMAGDFKMPKTYWPQEALTGSLEIIREYDDVRTIMVAGNHDEKGIGGTGLAPFRGVAWRVIEEPEIVMDMPQPILYAPFGSDLDRVRELSGKDIPLVAHAFLQGVALGPEEARLYNKGVPIEEYGQFRVAFFGDIHKGQWYTQATKYRPGGWQIYAKEKPVDRAKASSQARQIRKESAWKGEVFYPGSPYQQNWGERNDGMKGSLLIDLDDGEIWLHEHQAPKFRHIEVDQEQLEEILPTLTLYEGDFVRVVYTGKPCAAVDELEKYKPLFRHYQLIVRRVQSSGPQRADIHAGMGKRELLQAYMKARPPAPDLDQGRVFEAGVRLFAA